MSLSRDVVSLTSLCLQNIAENMQSFWMTDYTDKNMEDYNFMYIEGPFNQLGERSSEGVPQPPTYPTTPANTSYTPNGPSPRQWWTGVIIISCVRIPAALDTLD